MLQKQKLHNKQPRTAKTARTIDQSIVGKTFTRMELKSLDIVFTEKKIADLQIYGRGNEVFLVEKVSDDQFRIYMKCNWRNDDPPLDQ